MKPNQRMPQREMYTRKARAVSAKPSSRFPTEKSTPNVRVKDVRRLLSTHEASDGEEREEIAKGGEVRDGRGGLREIEDSHFPPEVHIYLIGKQAIVARGVSRKCLVVSVLWVSVT